MDDYWSRGYAHGKVTCPQVAHCLLARFLYADAEACRACSFGDFIGRCCSHHCASSSHCFAEAAAIHTQGGKWESADIAHSDEVDALEVGEVDAMLRIFKRYKQREPKPEEDPSLEQLAVLGQLLKAQTAYVDFGIFGPHSTRMQKRPSSMAWCRLLMAPWCGVKFGTHPISPRGVASLWCSQPPWSCWARWFLLSSRPTWSSWKSLWSAMATGVGA